MSCLLAIFLGRSGAMDRRRTAGGSSGCLSTPREKPLPVPPGLAGAASATRVWLALPWGVPVLGSRDVPKKIAGLDFHTHTHHLTACRQTESVSPDRVGRFLLRPFKPSHHALDASPIITRMSRDCLHRPAVTALAGFPELVSFSCTRALFWVKACGHLSVFFSTRCCSAGSGAGPCQNSAKTLRSELLSAQDLEVITHDSS